MKCAVIDVGSNSVRLLLWNNKKQLKTILTTRLAENFSDGNLNIDSINRTFDALFFFFKKAKELSYQDVFIFGTAILRKAKNSDILVQMVKEKTGLDLEIISGDYEAEIGLIGALKNNDGCVIDIGGASTEIIVSKEGKVVYSKSADMGAVTIKERSKDRKDAISLIEEKMKIYGDFNGKTLVGIGGTITTLASIKLKLAEYDGDKVDGSFLTFNEVNDLTDMLFNTPVKEREKIIGLDTNRKEIIPFGAQILLSIMKRLGVEKIIVSDSDNLEGYVFKRGLN